MPNGFQTKVLLWLQTRVNGRFQSKDQHIIKYFNIKLDSVGLLPCRCFGTVGIGRE